MYDKATMDKFYEAYAKDDEYEKELAELNKAWRKLLEKKRPDLLPTEEEIKRWNSINE